ncbi:hypothetical protein LUTEI9C_70223 [Luteimonas sp. 9C]|nr:hypothetical protein LUTEI9C_70223 [Luteimonas sp. 9C]
MQVAFHTDAPAGRKRLPYTFPP